MTFPKEYAARAASRSIDRANCTKSTTTLVEVLSEGRLVAQRAFTKPDRTARAVATRGALLVEIRTRPREGWHRDRTLRPLRTRDGDHAATQAACRLSAGAASAATTVDGTPLADFPWTEEMRRVKYRNTRVQTIVRTVVRLAIGTE